MLAPLYVICDADACAASGWSLVDFAAACLDGGATLLQIRDKRAGSRTLLDTVEAVVRRATPAGARVIVNDRADIARLAGAAGVHVGQDDLPPRLARMVVGPDALIGLSTHTPEQIAAAVRDGIEYLAVGPVFGTRTKDTGYDAVGLGLVGEAASAARPTSLPVVAIGGITLARVPAVIAAGASAVAVISDLLATGDPSARVRAYLARLAHV